MAKKGSNLLKIVGFSLALASCGNPRNEYRAEIGGESYRYVEGNYSFPEHDLVRDSAGVLFYYKFNGQKKLIDYQIAHNGYFSEKRINKDSEKVAHKKLNSVRKSLGL